MSRILIIALDGVTFDLIRPWVGEGRLPNLGRLMARGTSADLVSTIPPVTAPAFTSFMSGRNPGKTGVYHFIQPLPGTYEIQYVNTLSRRCRSLWNVLSEAGRSVGVIDVPMTYPPETVNGYIIAGTDTPDERSPYVSPVSLHERLARQFGDDYLRFGSMQRMNNIRHGRRAFLEREWRAVEHRTSLALHLMAEWPTDVTMVYFKATDHVQHLFWHCMDPRHPRYDARGATEFGDAILRTHQKVDAAIGALVAAAPDDADVIVMSDHGFGPSSPIVLRLNQFFASVGLLRYREPSLGRVDPRRLLRAAARRLYARLDRSLPHPVKVGLARRFPWVRRKLDFQRTSLGAIDWARTTAYCTEIMAGLSPGIWINLRGRQPAGIVSPEEYGRSVDLVIDRLQALRDLRTGGPLVTRVHRREAIYHGPHVALAPDLTLASWDGETFICRPSIPGQPLLESESGRPVADAEWSGTHRMNGILVAAGPRFRAGTVVAPSIVDLAPTILHLAGVAVPDDMDGRVLVEALDERFLAAHPLRSQAAEAGRPEASAPGDGYSREETEKIEEKLRGLGYIE